MEAGGAVRTSPLAKNENLSSSNNERSQIGNLNASNSLTTSDRNTKQTSKKNLPDGANSKEGFMIAIDTSKTSIVDSLVSIAAEEASFVPGRWERSFRRLGGKGEEGSMGL